MNPFSYFRSGVLVLYHAGLTRSLEQSRAIVKAFRDTCAFLAMTSVERSPKELTGIENRSKIF